MTKEKAKKVLKLEHYTRSSCFPALNTKRGETILGVLMLIAVFGMALGYGLFPESMYFVERICGVAIVALAILYFLSKIGFRQKCPAEICFYDDFLSIRTTSYADKRQQSGSNDRLRVNLSGIEAKELERVLEEYTPLKLS